MLDEADGSKVRPTLALQPLHLEPRLVHVFECDDPQRSSSRQDETVGVERRREPAGAKRGPREGDKRTERHGTQDDERRPTDGLHMVSG